MFDPINDFLLHFQAEAARAARKKYADATALQKLFKGTTYSQRRKDWFPSDAGMHPVRTIQQHEYDLLKICMASSKLELDSYWIELDVKYKLYLREMQSLDARRRRSLTARSLSVAAAVLRVERICAQYGYRLSDLRDRDCFLHLLGAEKNRHNRTGLIGKYFPLAHAICRILESNPRLITSNEDEWFLYFVRAAATGANAAWRVGGDANATAVFGGILKRLNEDRSEVVCRVCVAHENIRAKRFSAEDFLLILDEMIDSDSLTDELIPWFPGIYPSDLGYLAVHCGVPLSASTHILRGRSPAQIISQNIGRMMDSYRSDTTIAFDYLGFARALARDGQLDNAASAVASARVHGDLYARDEHQMWALCLAEAEADLARAECLRDRQPQKILAYMRCVDVAAGKAEALDLHRRGGEIRASLLRTPLDNSLQVH